MAIIAEHGHAREQLVALYGEFQKSVPPKGVGTECEDTQIDIDEYDGYVSGLVQSYLAGNQVEPASVNLGDNTAARLAKCEEKLALLRVHFELERKLVRQLIECLKSSL